jgi:hypothetical protein
MSGISGHVECFWCFCRYQRWHSPAQTVRVYMTASAQPTLHSAAARVFDLVDITERFSSIYLFGRIVEQRAL